MGFSSEFDKAFADAAPRLDASAPEQAEAEIYVSKELFDMTAPIFLQGLLGAVSTGEETASLLSNFSLVCQASRPNQFTTQRLADCLVEFVVNGKERQAKELITIFPFLLNKKGSAKDKDDRPYKEVYPRVAAFEVLDGQMFRMIDQVGRDELKDDYTPIDPEQDIDTYMGHLNQVAREALNPPLDEAMDAVIMHATQSQDDIDNLWNNHQHSCELNTYLYDWMDRFIEAAKLQPAAAIPYVQLHFWERVRYEKHIYGLSCQAFTLLLKRVERIVISCGTSELHQFYHQEARRTISGNLKLLRLDSFEKDASRSCRLGGPSAEDFSFFADIFLAGPRRRARAPSWVGYPWLGARVVFFKDYIKQKHQTWRAYAAADKPCEIMRDPMT